MNPVDAFIRAIEQESPGFRSEEELRHVFLKELETLSRKLGLPFQPRIEETVQTGRNDARVGAIIYEFKKPFRLDQAPTRSEALGEIRRYLDSVVKERQTPASKLQGFVTDGKSAAILAYSSSLKKFVTIDAFERSIREEEAFVPISQTSIWFEKSLRSLSHRELSPENLLEDFGPGSNICTSLVGTLWNLFQQAKDLRTKQPFYEQWKTLFSTATKNASSKDMANELLLYGLNPTIFGSVKEKEASQERVRVFLFIIHTYYSLIIKLLAVRVADELRLLGASSMMSLIEDDPKEGLKQAEENLPRLLANFVERDVFSWFLDSTASLSMITEMAKRFKHYDVEGVRRDVLKRVYQTTIPPRLRKSLGEFYTKDWVAELLLDETGYDGNGSILDPACGSGTFLALAIQRKKAAVRSKLPQEVLEEILNGVVGFDMNPIAVTTARMNYLLSILDIVKSARPARGINIPVYLCDSVRIPTQKPDISAATGGLGQSFVVPTSIGELRIPALRDPQSEHITLRILEEYSKRSVEEFLRAMREKIGEDQELMFRPVLRALHKRIAELEEQHINGIWARLVENFFAPLFTRRFDFVIGNPPWVAPVHVPKEYRDSVYQLVAASGFLRPYIPKLAVATARFPGAEEQYAACLPFVHLALDRYLKPGGKCAFLLTSSLIRLLHSGGWRAKMLDVKLEKLVDMTLITDIHEEATCWSFIPVVVNQASPRTERLDYKFIWKREEIEKIRRKAHPEERPSLLMKSWTTTKGQLSLDLTQPTSPWFVAPPEAVKVFRKMQKMYPRLGDAYRISMGIKTSANDYYGLKEAKVTGNYVTGVNLAGEKVIVEKELVYPVCKGEHIRAWKFDFTHLIIPHRPPDWKPIPEQVMKKSFPEALQYFSESHRKKRFEERTDWSKSKGPFYMVFRISKEKAASWRVAYAYTWKQLEASVIPEKTMSPVLGVEKELIVEETAYFVAAQNQAEAFYIGGLLNSLPLRAYVQSFSKPKGFPYFGYYQWNIGILPIPKFDQSNEAHMRVSQMSREAHKSHVADGLDDLAMSLYNLGKEELNHLQETLDMLTGNLHVAEALT